MEKDNAKQNPDSNHMRQQESQSELTRLIFRGQNFMATCNDQEMFYDCLSVGDNDSQSLGKFDDPKVIRATLERANNATGILLKNFDKSTGWNRPYGATLEITARLVNDQKQNLTGKPVTVQMPLQFDPQSGQLTSRGSGQQQKQLQHQVGPCDSCGLDMQAPKPSTDFPALMYMTDERPYKPNTATNAINSRAQDIQTEKSHMRDHWQPQINRIDAEAKPSQTESSYIREHHSENRFGADLNTKLSQTEISFIDDQYIRTPENKKEEPSLTNVRIMDHFQYPTNYQFSQPQERPSTSRRVCKCRSQPNIKQQQAAHSSHSAYPAESFRTVKSQPSVSTSCSSKAPESVYTTPYPTISCLPTCKAKADVNVCGINSNEMPSSESRQHPCGLYNSSNHCPHSPLTATARNQTSCQYKRNETTSQIVEPQKLNLCQTTNRNVPPYNQPSFGYEEQTSCTSHSRSIVGKITCLCDSRSICRPQNLRNEGQQYVASCGICDQKHSLSNRTGDAQNRQPMKLKCSRSSCVSQQFSKPQPGKALSKRVSLPNNLLGEDVFCDCQSSSNTSLTDRTNTSKGSKHLSYKSSKTVNCFSDPKTQSKETSFYSSKVLSMGTAKEGSASCVCSNVDQHKSVPIVTSCYSSKEPSTKAPDKSSKIKHPDFERIATTYTSKINKQDSQPIATSSFTLKDPSMTRAFEGSANCVCLKTDDPLSQPILTSYNTCATNDDLSSFTRNKSEPENSYKCAEKTSKYESVGVVMTCSVCPSASGHYGMEENDEKSCDQCNSYRSILISKEVIAPKPVKPRKQRILDMIEELSNAANCECNENERTEMIQQLFRELTLLLFQESEDDLGPQIDTEPCALTFEACCALQLGDHEPVLHQSKNQMKRLECFAKLDDFLEKCFMKRKPKPKSISMKEIGGFEFDSELIRTLGKSHSKKRNFSESYTELSEMENELVAPEEEESNVFLRYCDCEEGTLQEPIVETEMEQLMETVDEIVPEAKECSRDASLPSKRVGEVDESGLYEESLPSQPVAEDFVCDESKSSRPFQPSRIMAEEWVCDESLPVADECGLCEESLELAVAPEPIEPCHADPRCPPDPCKMIEECGDCTLIPNGLLSPQARELFELLLRQALHQCEGQTGEEECEKESLTPCVLDPHPEPCRCCHCRALMCENECKTVTKTVDSAMCDPVCEMKYFIDSIIVDLHAMDHVLGKKKAKPKNVKGSRDLDKPSRESFPVTITDVSSLGCTALYIRWEVEDCTGIAGYEIYVDGHLTNRFYSFRHVAGVVANVDVTKTHQIVVRAHAMGQDFPGEGSGNNNRTVVNAHPEMLVGAEKPWSPSVYFYDPS